MLIKTDIKSCNFSCISLMLDYSNSLMIKVSVFFIVNHPLIVEATAVLKATRFHQTFRSRACVTNGRSRFGRVPCKLLVNCVKTAGWAKAGHIVRKPVLYLRRSLILIKRYLQETVFTSRLEFSG